MIGRTAHPDHLRRAAADIEDQSALRVRIDERRAAKRGQSRFLLGCDDFQFYTGFGLRPFQQNTCVVRATTGLRRNGANA